MPGWPCLCAGQRHCWVHPMGREAPPEWPVPGSRGRRGGAVIARQSPEGSRVFGRRRGSAEAYARAGRKISDTERAAAAQADMAGVDALRSILKIRPFRRLWMVLGIASL